MSLVVDANAVVRLLAVPPSGEAARSWFDRWKRDGEDLHVPDLFTYEVASALTGMEKAGQITPARSEAVWAAADTLDLTFHPPSSGSALVAIARLLERRSAYDAAYVDLALRLDTELWTLDGKLARNARSVGLPVQLMV
ncbi:MAG: type II toxin-antitoxin system VapC family toxin [Candidatus Dormibacteraeota bacterium]|uniref:Ribonuclease VapC n=1 Tax=Candidatus Aeolococcus gillhamiae TaxID=3127015 RepID=A0A2W5Z330_9BACT|nr:type II toxin-antitoxin system VapC family toxin [Candidatus Dormibacteraeota bacterium]PZR79643.1 MAG: nucleic acid-binding protein [Candidatus Dormibacter sp. RRmetagenome_bin12]